MNNSETPDISAQAPLTGSVATLPSPKPDYRVVAIGASAGGLEALEDFFDGLGNCPGAAFVVIQHLSPDHKSMMEQLLGRHTPMPVVMVEDGMLLAPGKVHLLPPGAVMSLDRGRLHLTDVPPFSVALGFGVRG